MNKNDSPQEFTRVVVIGDADEIHAFGVIPATDIIIIPHLPDVFIFPILVIRFSDK
jgi:hypothetical protein